MSSNVNECKPLPNTPRATPSTTATTTSIAPWRAKRAGRERPPPCAVM